MEADLGALYDKMTAQGIEEAEPAEPAPQPEPEQVAAEEAPPAEAEAAPEPAPEPVEVPTGLPADLRSHWAKVPAEAREAILKDRDGLQRKLSDMGRQVQGIAPVREALVEAVQRFPALSNMKPQDAAREIFQLAEISQQFAEKPVETMLGLVRKHGLEKAMAQALGGQPVTQDATQVNTLRTEIQRLQRQLAQVSDPEYLAEKVTQITTQRDVLNSVQKFAAEAEHWEAVEEHIPLYIPAVKAKLGNGASEKDILAAAYERAIQDFVPEAKAPKPAAVEAPAVPDPERVKAALNAKSVNVSGRSTGTRRVLTEAEELSMAYDRAAKR